MNRLESASVRGIFRRVIAGWRLLRRWSSRRRSIVWLLGLEYFPSDRETTGVIILQIDGLSRRQFERGVERGKLPFIRHMLRVQDCRLETFYSGQPSTTPAVQAELFYGIRSVVPAFAFRDSERGQAVEMIQPSVAAAVERRCAAEASGLLTGGSSYCNIYAGGAAEPHFCAAALDGSRPLRAAGWWRLFVVVIWNFMAVVRTIGLLLAEFLVAIVDYFRGILSGGDLWAELKLVPRRVAVAVLMRELIVVGVEADATRGMPIIHANFLGYDEQSHGRGPDSAMAFWSLKHIDGAIERIVDAARSSHHRDYQVWVYSDHGQESSTPYEELHSRTLDAVVQAYVDEAAARRLSPPSTSSKSGIQGIRSQRAGWLGGRWAASLNEMAETVSAAMGDNATVQVTVTAKGPLGHIYLPTGWDAPMKHRLAARLADEGQVPWVFMIDAQQGWLAWHRQGRYPFPQKVAALLGPEHPFADAIARDLQAVCSHRDAGDLVVLGWQQDGPTVSFVHERGSHAGPGPEETGGFILVPADLSSSSAPEQGIWRPDLLREAIIEQLRPDEPDSESMSSRTLRGESNRHRIRMTGDDQVSGQPALTDGEPTSKRSLRVMTYNVHSCLGIDGRLSPKRIARVIRHCDPDIVALQEVDVGRLSSGRIDQARWIAAELELEHHFHPSFAVGEEYYGNVILSRFPIRRHQAGPLPTLASGRPREPRAAVWVTVDVDGAPWQVFATHLGLNRRERMTQVEALLGPGWLDHPECEGPVVLCGDFNAGPGSPAYRRLVGRLADAQASVDGHRPKNTWRSSHPVLRLDHVFLSEGLVARDAMVPRNHLARVASDHLPLLVEVTPTIR